ncbi:MAG: YceH family protein [Phycisphaerae bacterium]|nr:YceH family protein [Phycisphaerae bacterium]
MAITLNAMQRRVLGVLIEKSLTTPAGYPMTLNAVVTGCNQLTCRDPVMHLSEGDVARAIHELQQLQLVSQAPPERTARANRFQHEVEARFGWSTRERALMAELLLRGPQTVGELKSNASRMTPLEDIHYVAELLSTLASREPPFVMDLPRQPGKSVTRYDHRLYPADEPREYAHAPGADSVVKTGTESPDRALELVQRVERLEREVELLREQVYRLRALADGSGTEA